MESAHSQTELLRPSKEQVVTQPVVTRRDDAAGGSHLSGVQSHYFLRGKQTGNAYSLTEILFQPGAQGNAFAFAPSGGGALLRHRRGVVRSARRSAAYAGSWQQYFASARDRPQSHTF